MDILQFDLNPCPAVQNLMSIITVTTCPIIATFVFIMILKCGQALARELTSPYSHLASTAATQRLEVFDRVKDHFIIHLGVVCLGMQLGFGLNIYRWPTPVAWASL
ncbi:Hypothetical predicted protein [Marmota monax]|uniref:Uncharacterized protein n=1 Tax=Marmota monax TaxID=9995 RepID=A0A5E4D7L1_MARMO|nr:hypothetical protein GHT09_019655 [Marmota monax]VTJ90018.1 Hypothetical predicted protein [Marmota monax]